MNLSQLGAVPVSPKKRRLNLSSLGAVPVGAAPPQDFGGPSWDELKQFAPDMLVFDEEEAHAAAMGPVPDTLPADNYAKSWMGKLKPTSGTSTLTPVEVADNRVMSQMLADSKSDPFPYDQQDVERYAESSRLGQWDAPIYDGSVPMSRLKKPLANKAIKGIRASRDIEDDELLNHLNTLTDDDLREGADAQFRKDLNAFSNYRNVRDYALDNKVAQDSADKLLNNVRKRILPKARKLWGEALDNQERYENLKQLLREEIDTGEGFYGGVKDRSTARAATQAIMDSGTLAASAYYKLTGKKAKADDLNLTNMALAEVLDEYAGGSKLEGAARGVGSSLFQGLLLARLGGGGADAGKLARGASVATQAAGFGEGTRNQTYAQASMSPLTEGERTSVANKQGMIEAGVMGAFSAAGAIVGGATVEQVLGGAKVEGVKQLAKMVGLEMGEESLTTWLQDLQSKLGGLTPDDTPVMPQLIDTWLQTGLTLGVVNGSQKIANFLATPSAQNAKAADIPDSLASDQAARESLARAVRFQVEARNPAATSSEVVQPTQWPDFGPQAPTSPVDALPPDTTPEPSQALPTQPEPSGEAVLPPEQGVPEQVDSGLSTNGGQTAPINPAEVTADEFAAAAIPADEAMAIVQRLRAGDARSKNGGESSGEPKTGPLVATQLPVGIFTDEYIQFLRESTNSDRVASYAGQAIDSPIYALPPKENPGKHGRNRWIASDGGHRLLAAIERGDQFIPAIVPPEAHKSLVDWHTLDAISRHATPGKYGYDPSIEGAPNEAPPKKRLGRRIQPPGDNGYQVGDSHTSTVPSPEVSSQVSSVDSSPAPSVAPVEQPVSVPPAPVDSRVPEKKKLGRKKEVSLSPPLAEPVADVTSAPAVGVEESQIPSTNEEVAVDQPAKVQAEVQADRKETARIRREYARMRKAATVDPENGLFKIVQGGRAGLEEKLVKTDDAIHDILEQYRGSRRSEEANAERDSGYPASWDDFEGGSEVGDAEVAEEEADDFQLSREAPPAPFKQDTFESQPDSTQKAFITGIGKDDRLQETLFDPDGIAPSAREKADTQNAVAKKAIGDFLSGFKNTLATSGGIDPEQLKRAIVMVREVTKAGITEFKAFVEMVRNAAPDLFSEISPYLESAWQSVHGGGPKAPDKTLAQESRSPTSLKNATVDRERAERGLPTLATVARQENQEAWDEAMQRIDRDSAWQNQLAEELHDKPRAVSPVENAALLHQRVTLHHDYDNALEDFQKAQEAGDVAATADADARLSAASARLEDHEGITKRVGTEAGRSLQARKMMADEHYTLAKMEMESRAAKGRALTIDERNKLAELQKQITDLQNQLDETKKKLDEREIDAGIDETLKTAADGNRKRLGKKQGELLDKSPEKVSDDDQFADILAKAMGAPEGVPRPKKRLASKAKEARSKLKDSLANLRKTLGERAAFSSTGFDPAIIRDVASVTADAFRAGTYTFAEYVQVFATEFGPETTRKLAGYLERAWAEVGKLSSRVDAPGSVEAELAKPTPTSTGDPKILANIKRKKSKDEVHAIHHELQQLAEGFWKQGIRGREEMVDAVHGAISGVMGKDWTRENTRVALSGYGNFKPVSKDEVLAGVADIKTQIQQTLKMEAIVAGRPIEMTGGGRRALSDAARRLVQTVNELKRKHGVVVTDPEKQLKSAIDARKTYYKHRMADLKHEIEAKQKNVKQKSNSPTDPELDGIIKEYETIKAEHAAIFGKPELTDEQRLERAVKAAERSEAYWKGRAEDAKNGKYDAPKKLLRPVTSPALEVAKAQVALHKAVIAELKDLDVAVQEAKKENALNARIERLREQIAANDIDPKAKESTADTEKVANLKEQVKALEERKKELKNAKYPPKTREEIALQSLKTRLANEAVKLEEKIANEDYTKKERKPIVRDAEAARLQAKLDILKKTHHDNMANDRWKKLSVWGKVNASKVEAYDLLRSILATGELSFVLRQGKFAMSHPIKQSRNLVASLRAFASEETASTIENQIKEHPLFAKSQQAGLFFSDQEGALSRQEEFAIGKLVGKVPGLRNFARAGRVFLNKTRFDLFEAMSKSMSKAGEATPEQMKQFAMFANEATGRGGLGAFERSAVNLNRIFFSPRFVVSRFQLLAGHSMWGGDARSRKVIAMEYARNIAALSVYYAALGWMLSDDDDEVTVSKDPTSSDFLKLKVGDTRLDPLAGLSQAAVLLGRTVAAGGEAAGFGDESNDAYNRKVWRDTASDFMWSKAHPTLGKIANALSGSDMVGNQATIGSEAAVVGPIAWGDMKDAFEEHGLKDGAQVAAAIFLGESVQRYNKLDLKIGDDPVKHAEKLAKLVYANRDKPIAPLYKRGKRKGQVNTHHSKYPDYQERLSTWEAKRSAAQAWLSKHSSEPVVQEAERKVKAEKKAKEKIEKAARDKAISEGRQPAAR